jgi:hypothetical protein
MLTSNYVALKLNLIVASLKSMSCRFVLWLTAPQLQGSTVTPHSSRSSISTIFPYSCLKLFGPTRPTISPGDIVFLGLILHAMDQLDGIHFADGFDEKDGLPRLRKLLDSKWNISSDGKGIEKKFHFKNHTNVLVCICLRNSKRKLHLIYKGFCPLRWCKVQKKKSSP